MINIDGVENVYSEHLSCPYCDFSIPKLEPRLLSFNAPYGACPTCKGLGFLKQIDYDQIVPDDSLSINQSAIRYYKNIFSRNIIICNSI